MCVCVCVCMYVATGSLIQTGHGRDGFSLLTCFSIYTHQKLGEGISRSLAHLHVNQKVDSEFSWGGGVAKLLHVVSLRTQSVLTAWRPHPKRDATGSQLSFCGLDFHRIVFNGNKSRSRLHSHPDQETHWPWPVESCPNLAVRRKECDGAVALGKSSLPQFKEKKHEQASAKSKSTEF